MHECTHIRRRVHLHVYMLCVWTCIIGCTRGNVIYTWLGHTHTRGGTYTRGALYTRGVLPGVLSTFNSTNRESRNRFANTALGEHK